MTFKMVVAVSYPLLLLINLGLSTYIIYTKLDSLELYFRDNAMMIGCRKMFGGGTHRERWIMLLHIGTVIMFPKLFIWRGLVKQQEIDAIPLGLRRWAKASVYVDIPLLLGVIAYGISLLFR